MTICMLSIVAQLGYCQYRIAVRKEIIKTRRENDRFLTIYELQ